MKHRIIFITTIIGIIITSIIFNNVTFSTYRYHQHKEDQVDEEDFKDVVADYILENDDAICNSYIKLYKLIKEEIEEE